MSRVRTLIIAAALVAGPIALFATLLPDIALAQCSKADQCTASVCSALQDEVHPSCDQERSCRDISKNDKTELVRRLLINQQCLLARTDVAGCFSKPDRGHRQAIQDARNAIATCRGKLEQK